jgi:hypothetical protein
VLSKEQQPLIKLATAKINKITFDDAMQIFNIFTRE